MVTDASPFPRPTARPTTGRIPVSCRAAGQDDGTYVSVDVADRFFDNEAQGYLVILGSGPKDDPSTRALAEKARSLFPLAELRTDDVWQGRSH